VYTFLKTWKVSIWSVKMAFIPCVHFVYCWIWKFSQCFTVEFVNEMVYSHGKLKLLNRSVCDFLGFASTNICAHGTTCENTIIMKHLSKETSWKSQLLWVFWTHHFVCFLPLKCVMLLRGFGTIGRESLALTNYKNA
jgi:hypothetical protein